MVGRGDQWVSGGALAISALAAEWITIGAQGLHQWSAAAGTLHTLTLTLWAISAAWLPALILTKALRPRLGYNVGRWSTVWANGQAACLSSSRSGLQGSRPGYSRARLMAVGAIVVRVRMLGVGTFGINL